MKHRNLLLATLLSLSLVLYAGCENKNGNTNGGGNNDSSPSSSSSSRGGGGSSSDGELNDVLKRGLNREALADLPMDITDISINWDKTASEASGRFSVKTKTTEGLYTSISNSDALRKLGITDLYEGELNVARGKINNLPEPHRTNLRNAISEDQLNRFRFYDTVVPRGGEVTLTGSAELVKYGNDWSADRIRVNSFSVGDNFTPESKLRDEYKLDDPKTKEAVNAVIQARRDFVARVDTTVADVERQQQEAAAEAERQRLAELQRQQDALDAQYKTILEYIKPDARYEGTWSCTRWGAQSAGITVVFGQYNANQTSIDGTYYLTGAPDAWVAFQLHIKPDKVESLPIKGKRGYFTPDAKAAYDQRGNADRAWANIAGSFFHYSMTEINLGIVDGKLIGTFAPDAQVDLGKPK